METKMCKRNGEIKPVTEFGPSSTSKDGLQSWCKECSNEYNRLRDKYKHLGGVKLCHIGREFKPRTEFDPCDQYKDGLFPYCREHDPKRHDGGGNLFPDTTDLSAFTLRQLLDELKRRGYAGELTRMEKD